MTDKELYERRIKQLLALVQPYGSQTRAVVPGRADEPDVYEEKQLNISELCTMVRAYLAPEVVNLDESANDKNHFQALVEANILQSALDPCKWNGDCAQVIWSKLNRAQAIAAREMLDKMLGTMATIRDCATHEYIVKGGAVIRVVPSKKIPESIR